MFQTCTLVVLSRINERMISCCQVWVLKIPGFFLCQDVFVWHAMAETIYNQENISFKSTVYLRHRSHNPVSRVALCSREWIERAWTRSEITMRRSSVWRKTGWSCVIHGWVWLVTKDSSCRTIDVVSIKLITAFFPLDIVVSQSEFTEFTEASSTADTAGMSRHRLAPYTVHYLKTLLILVVSGS